MADANANSAANMSQVMRFFGMSTSDFRAQWAALSYEEKAYFKTAVGEEISEGFLRGERVI